MPGTKHHKKVNRMSNEDVVATALLLGGKLSSFTLPTTRVKLRWRCTNLNVEMYVPTRGYRTPSEAARAYVTYILMRAKNAENESAAQN